MALLPWPTFEFVGKLTRTGGSTALLNAIRAQGEPFLTIQGGKFKLFGQGARTMGWGTFAAGCYSERAYDPNDPLSGWADGSTATMVAPVNGTNNKNACDTAGYIHHPVTLEHLWHFEARPGTAPVEAGGEIGSIQVATASEPPRMLAFEEPTFWNKTNLDILVATLPHEAGWQTLSGEWRGGLGETSPTFRQATSKVRLFYESVTNYEPPSGPFTWSVSYADSTDGKTSWTKRPTPFWNPAQIGNPAQAYLPEGFRGAWQPSFSVDPTDPNVIWGAMMGSVNEGGRVILIQSDDGGDTWYEHPSNHSGGILRVGMPNGPPGEGALGAPHLIVDDLAGVYWLVVDGADGVRGINDIYLAKALRPAGSVEAACDAALAAFIANGALKFYSIGGRTVKRAPPADLMRWRRAVCSGDFGPGGVNFMRRGRD